MAQQQQGNVIKPAPQLGPQTVVLPYYGAPQPIKYNSVAAKVLGSIQIVIGVACIIFNGVAFTKAFTCFIISYGIWGGAIFFVAGLLQVLSGRNPPSNCLIISTMVMSVIAACIASVVFSLSITDAIFCRYDYYRMYSSYLELGLNCAMAVLSFIEAVVAITASALCCKALCCCGANSYLNNFVQWNGNPVYVYENKQVMQIPAYPGYAFGMTPASQLYVSPTLYPTFQ